MARTSGSPSNVRISLSELNNLFKDYANLPIAVGVGFLRNAAETLNVDVTAYLPKVDDSPKSTESATNADSKGTGPDIE